LKLDYFYSDHGIPMNVENLSVEHILLVEDYYKIMFACR
jgi:hypothetical protein